MDTVNVRQTIVCTKARRGDGKLTPIRVVKEVFELDGSLIAEEDHLSFTIETLLRFIDYRFKGEEKEKIAAWAMDYFVEENLETQTT